MNELADRVEHVVKQYLGPAAGAFLRRELASLGVSLDFLREQHVPVLAQRAEHTAARVMDHDRLVEFVQALRECAPETVPTSDTFRSVAREALARDDIAAATSALREGASALVRKNDRAAARGLLEQAVAMAPADLAAHRRLAAALVNAGDVNGACAEYGRFIDVALTRGDSRRAWLELTYARELLGELPQLLSITDRLMAAPPPMPVAHAEPAPAVAMPMAAGASTQAAAATPAAPRAAPPPSPAAPAPALPRRDAAPLPRVPDSSVLDEAERFLINGKVQAAADLLLDLVANGCTDRRAQRLLIDIDCKLGRRDVARDKCRALGIALRLDGRADAAGDVERLATLL